MPRRSWSTSSTDHDNGTLNSDTFDFNNGLSPIVSEPPASHHAPDLLGAVASDGLSGLVLVNGDGEVFSPLSHAAGGKTSGTGGTTSGTSTTTGSASTSPFVINVTYDASVANAPAGFTTAVANVVQYLESQVTDHVT